MAYAIEQLLNPDLRDKDLTLDVRLDLLGRRIKEMDQYLGYAGVLAQEQFKLVANERDYERARAASLAHALSEAQKALEAR